MGPLGVASIKAIKARGEEAEVMNWLGVYGLVWYDDKLDDNP